MMNLDYQKLGFKCGLEAHQQLEGRKLFCRCPAINSTKEADIKIIRRLRASAGETGEIDVSAKHEMEKQKYFIYEGNSEDTCLVELDEEPPYAINPELVDAALEVSLLLNAKIVDEIQVMRKTVVDGSNTSGFQRTALIAASGHIDTSLGRVNIPLICLEEEAAQKLDETKECARYRLDRLGIGLIEIGTSADIKTPEHAKEVASILGMVLRSTAKVKRGLGTIRQDVNVSIENGARTEIKGFQELKSIPKVIEYEVERQLKLIEEGKKIEQEVRKAEPGLTTSFLRPMPGAARLYPETDIAPLKITKERISKIKLPELITNKIKNFEKKYSISEQLAKELINDLHFEGYAGKFRNIEPNIIANILINTPKEIRTRLKLDSSRIKQEDFEAVLSGLNDKKITKEAIIDLLADACRGREIDISKFKTISEDELENEIKKIIKEKPGLNASAYMGIIMAKHRGKADGRMVMEILKRSI